jgi:hypothetical protein
MSVSFRYPEPDNGVAGTLDLSNGMASGLLRLMGYKVTEETSGELEIIEARDGIKAARETLTDRIGKISTKSYRGQLDGDDASALLHLASQLEHLWNLSDVVTALLRAGEGKLTWF